MNPYISIVATSRNDNHGGNMLKRMRLFVKGLLHQSRRYQLPMELIMVEWNPPTDRPLLQEILPKPEKGDYLTIRYIIVPERLHQTYKRGETIPLFQMNAKNVGIRRARGEFVLCSNIDLQFSDALFEILQKRQLKKDEFYRCNRIDIPDEVDEDWSWEKFISFAEQNQMRILGHNAANVYLPPQPQWVYRFPKLVDWLDKYHSRKYLKNNGKISHIIRGLDTNACGDFTMMHKDAWLDIRGYVEFDLYSIHIDSLGIYQAASLGYKQVIFPIEACTYHIDHPSGWESMDPFEKMIFLNERPGLGYDIVWEAAPKMIETPTRIALNKDDWGFANEQLEEYEFTGK